MDELTIEEKYQNIRTRITELEAIETQTQQINKEKMQELEVIEQQAREVRSVINQNIFANTLESEELKELKIVEKWFEEPAE